MKVYCEDCADYRKRTQVFTGTIPEACLSDRNTHSNYMSKNLVNKFKPEVLNASNDCLYYREKVAKKKVWGCFK